MIRGVVAAALIATTAAADEPRLGQPVQCTVGHDCFVQNYVDREPGPGHADFMCGPLSYDGHKGTDFRPANPRRPLSVIAAAPGTVKARRDGMADAGVRALGRQAVAGAECGNGVLIDHGDGWVTQYCHMARGSLRVRVGEVVARGQQLGRIGLSGQTEFHHLHFELRKDGRVVDPFIGPDAPQGCGAGRSLWQQPIAYVGRAVLAAGFTDAAPTLGELEAGRHRARQLALDAPQMLFWVQVMGLRAGDRERLQLAAPDGTVLADVERVASATDRAQWLAYVGQRRREPGWAPGVYRGEYRLTRDGAELLRANATVRVAAQ